MDPFTPLNQEHRIIEAMLERTGVALSRSRSGHSVAPATIDTLVDFMRVYADQTHHGKEEGILFPTLAERAMSDRDVALMAELKHEHVLLREAVARLDDANRRYHAAQDDARLEILDTLQAIVRILPAHMRKEETRFFPACEKYLSPEAREAVLAEFRRFDQTMIHHRYAAVAEEFVVV